jgi:hypothetical protein
MSLDDTKPFEELMQDWPDGTPKSRDNAFTSHLEKGGSDLFKPPANKFPVWHHMNTKRAQQ